MNPQLQHISGLLGIALAQIAVVWADPTMDLVGKIAVSVVTLLTVLLTDRTKQENAKVILRTVAGVAAVVIAAVISSASLGTGAVAVLSVLAAVFVRLQAMLPAPKLGPPSPGTPVVCALIMGSLLLAGSTRAGTAAGAVCKNESGDIIPCEWVTACGDECRRSECRAKGCTWRWNSFCYSTNPVQCGECLCGEEVPR